MLCKEAKERRNLSSLNLLQPLAPPKPGWEGGCPWLPTACSAMAAASLGTLFSSLVFLPAS